MAKVLVVSDTHFPFAHEQYLRFIKDARDKHKPDVICHIGDVVDQHSAAPNYDSDPNGRSTGDEMVESLEHTRLWHKTFPKALVCIGNHDKRHITAARKAGLNDRYLKDFAEVWETPSWKWALSHEIDGVRYEHGTGSSGKNAAINRAIEHRQSTVIGHVHAWAGTLYHANNHSVIFGLNVGAGIDLRAYAFEYGVDYVVRPMLGCGLVVDGEAGLFIPMKCGPGERYSRTKR